MGKRATYTAEDSFVLSQAAQDALEDYQEGLGKVSLNDMFMSYGGRSELAQQLAGTTDKSSRAYKTQYENIRHWEKGIRNPEKSQTTQGKFKNLYTQQNPPPAVDITMSGWVGYDDKFYYRTISSDKFKKPVNTAQFLQHIREGNTHEAYQDLFEAYGIGRGSVRMSNDNPSIDISFR
jgi:hypothetical protein